MSSPPLWKDEGRRMKDEMKKTKRIAQNVSENFILPNSAFILSQWGT
jgi:hypothetical protein